MISNIATAPKKDSDVKEQVESKDCSISFNQVYKVFTKEIIQLSDGKMKEVFIPFEVSRLAKPRYFDGLLSYENLKDYYESEIEAYITITNFIQDYQGIMNVKGVSLPEYDISEFTINSVFIKE